MFRCVSERRGCLDKRVIPTGSPLLWWLAAATAVQQYPPWLPCLTGGKLVFQARRPFPVLRADGEQPTIERNEAVRTTSRQDQVKAPADDPAWERALKAWRVTALSPFKSVANAFVFDAIVDHGWKAHTNCLLLRVRWFGYLANDDTQVSSVLRYGAV